MGKNAKTASKASTASDIREQVRPGAIDTFLVLLWSMALTLFLLLVGSRVGGIGMLEELPDWFREGSAAIWSAAAAGGGGIALAVGRALTGRHPTLNYPRWILALTASFMAVALVLPIGLSRVRTASADGADAPITSATPLEGFMTLPPHINPKDPGKAYTQKTFDFNNDKQDDHCRIVGDGPYYYLCGPDDHRHNWGEVDGPGLVGWGGAWVDWDGDGWMDWCSVTGMKESTKYFSCTFTDGQKPVSSIKIEFDAGYPASFEGRNNRVEWKPVDGVMSYCRYVGSFPPNWTMKCAPSTGRGINLN